MRWRLAVGALACPIVNKVRKRRLLELAKAVVVRECVGALNLEH